MDRWKKPGEIEDLLRYVSTANALPVFKYFPVNLPGPYPLVFSPLPTPSSSSEPIPPTLTSNARGTHTTTTTTLPVYGNPTPLMAPTDTQTQTHTHQQQCAKYQYVVTAAGPKIVPVPSEVESRDEESAADYNTGGYLAVKLKDTFKDGRYIVQRKLGWVAFSARSFFCV